MEESETGNEHISLHPFTVVNCGMFLELNTFESERRKMESKGHGCQVPERLGNGFERRQDSWNSAFEGRSQVPMTLKCCLKAFELFHSKKENRLVVPNSITVTRSPIDPPYRD